MAKHLVGWRFEGGGNKRGEKLYVGRVSTQWYGEAHPQALGQGRREKRGTYFILPTYSIYL